MKVVIEQGALLKALTHIQNVVERRATIPILSNVLLVAESGTLALTATDMQIEMREKIAAETEQEGGLTAPAHMLHEIVRHISDGAQIELTTIDGEGNDSPHQLMVRAGHSEFMLQTLPQEDFHFMAQEEMPVAFTIGAPTLRRLIEKTRDAISTEDTRYYLNGIYFHINTEEGDVATLRAVTSDGHRLAMAETVRPAGAEDMPAIIVPRKTVNEIARLIEDMEGEVSLQISDTTINFAFDDILLTSKLIDGQFPDYMKVIPRKNDKELQVDARELMKSVDRVASILSEKSKAVRLDIQENHVTLSVNNPQNASATDEIDARFSGEQVAFSFNAKFLNDAIMQFTDNPLIIKFADPSSSILIYGEDDLSALYVLMPMRI